MRDRIKKLMRRGRERLSSKAAAVRDRASGVSPSDVRNRLESMDADAVREKLEQIDPAFLSRGADEITDADADRVARSADEIASSFDRSGALGRLLDDGHLLLQMVKDARSGRYRSLPRWTLSAVVFSLLYVLNPMDLIPDVIPGVGAIDDAAVVSLCLLLIEQDLLAYRSWRQALPSVRDTGRNGERSPDEPRHGDADGDAQLTRSSSSRQ